MLELTVEKIEETEAYNKFMDHCPVFPDKFVKLMPGETVMPEFYLEFHERMKGFQLRADDVWVASFPKSGTTWTQEMVWNVMNNVDLETAKSVKLDKRVPFLEIGGIKKDIYKKMKAALDMNEMLNKEGGNNKDQDPGPEGMLKDSMDTVTDMPMDKPRIIKTHLPVQLLPREVLEKGKIVYVSRNPRDVVLSWYNHWKILEDFTGDFDTMFDAFLENVGGYFSPFFNHNINWWNIRHQENVLFIFYEDMKKDLKSVIEKVSSFLGKQLSQEQILALEEHLQFDNMKKNDAVNKKDIINIRKSLPGYNGGDRKFMNKGVSGGWRNKLTEVQKQRIEAWENKHLQNTDLKYSY